MCVPPVMATSSISSLMMAWSSSLLCKASKRRCSTCLHAYTHTHTSCEQSWFKRNNAGLINAYRVCVCVCVTCRSVHASTVVCVLSCDFRSSCMSVTWLSRSTMLTSLLDPLTLDVNTLYTPLSICTCTHSTITAPRKRDDFSKLKGREKHGK